ncbi:DUF2913 family protein [Enterobacter hormaechei]|uniref:DUF2913 family protein n=1 Tax=Enterobacter hormaechei TaxID=158836 RepID=UPI003970387D|nr:DUF2913 family protein [Klebsiella quasipneumoniae]
MEKYRHIAFCALASLGIHKKYYGFNSFLQENIYILRWLNAARNEKRFSQDFTPYLNKLIELTRQQIATTSMRKKLDDYWYLSAQENINQIDYFRLKSVQNTLENAGYPWFNLAAKELKQKLNEYTGKGIFTEWHALNCAFSLQGKLVTPVRMIVPNMDDIIQNIFFQENFLLTRENNNKLLWTLTTCS